MDQMEAERLRRVEEKRPATEEQHSQAAIYKIQREDLIARMADDTVCAQLAELLQVERPQKERKYSLEIARLEHPQADELQRIQEEKVCLEHEREVLRQSMGVSPNLYPQTYLPPTPSGPIPPLTSPHICVPSSYSAQLFSPPPLLYPQPQGGISLHNVSSANISITSFPPPPITHNINSGNVANVSLSNVNNNNGKCMYLSPLLTCSALTFIHMPARRKRQA